MTLHTPKASYKNYFVYDTEPETDPLIIVDMVKPCYYVVPRVSNTEKSYRFLKFSDGYLYLSSDDEGKIYRAKLKVLGIKIKRRVCSFRRMHSSLFCLSFFL